MGISANNQIGLVNSNSASKFRGGSSFATGIQRTEGKFRNIQDSLEKIYLDNSTPKEVRRRILEASVRAPETWHQDAVTYMYSSGDKEWAWQQQWPIVWTRSSVHSESCHQDWPERAFGKNGDVTSDEGLGALPEDEDGLIRRYKRLITINGPPAESDNNAGPCMLRLVNHTVGRFVRLPEGS